MHVVEVREVIKTGNPVNKENLTLKTNPEVIPEGSSHLSAPWLNIHCLPPPSFSNGASAAQMNGFANISRCRLALWRSARARARARAWRGRVG